MSIGKHRRGRPGKAGVDYQGHTGRGVQTETRWVATDPMNSGLNPMYRALIGGCVFGIYSFYVDGIPPHKPISHSPQVPI